MWSRAEVEQHSVELRQFIDFRQSTLAGGQRIIEAYNSSGLSFTLLPDRGLDIWAASYNGQSLTWLSQNAPHRPEEGSSWLRSFSGGLMTTCGLTHMGPPEHDDETGEFRDIHGRYTYQPAQNIAVSGGWQSTDNGEKFVLELRGTVVQAALFGEQLRLERTYRMVLGEPTLEVADRITNVGDLTTPLMVLYHCNVGYPLVREGAELITASYRVHARDAAAEQGLDRWPDYDGPVAQYPEQVFWHHVCADAQGWSEAALVNDDLGLSIKWDTGAMPYLTQWKNTRQGVYVCGVEQSNCLVVGQNAEKQSGRLQTIEPGGVVNYTNQFTVLDGADAINDVRTRINQLAASGTPTQAVIDDYPVFIAGNNE